MCTPQRQRKDRQTGAVPEPPRRRRQQRRRRRRRLRLRRDGKALARIRVASQAGSHQPPEQGDAVQEAAEEARHPPRVTFCTSLLHSTAFRRGGQAEAQQPAQRGRGRDADTSPRAAQPSAARRAPQPVRYTYLSGGARGEKRFNEGKGRGITPDSSTPPAGLPMARRTKAPLLVELPEASLQQRPEQRPRLQHHFQQQQPRLPARRCDTICLCTATTAATTQPNAPHHGRATASRLRCQAVEVGRGGGGARTSAGALLGSKKEMHFPQHRPFPVPRTVPGLARAGPTSGA